MATIPLDLRPSLKKIERAKRKLDNLKTIVNAYDATHPYTLREQLHGHSVYVIARVQQPAPEDVAWELVEAVGHLRSALDKMTVALVEKNNRGVSGVGFPFGGMSSGKPDPFPSAREDRLKKKLTPDQWAFILAQKPYPTGNDMLWAVNELANEDKHRRDLVTARPQPVIHQLRISEGFSVGPGIQVHDQWPIEIRSAVLKDQEAEVILMSVGTASKANINAQVTVEVVFNKIEPVAGKPVLIALNEMINLTEGIVQRAADAF